MNTIRRASAPIVVAVVLGAVALSAQDTGWVIDRFEARYAIQSDGSLVIAESVDVDFLGLSRRGIFRDIDDRFDFDSDHIRQYAVTLSGVTAADGRARQARVERAGSATRFRIGDPDRTVTGKQAYRITYTVGGALNGFPDHDELYWNATGEWPVPVVRASVVLTAPAGAIEGADCFLGPRGSTERCEARVTADEAVFTAGRALAAGEQMTIVTALKKGAVPEPRPYLTAKSVTPDSSLARLFDATPAVLIPTVVGLVAVVGSVAGLWWRVGRDRRYVSLHHLSGDSTEERVPLFGGRPVGVEFEPPDGIRPGQLGLIIDERADTLDVTATIVDLAVRGYLKITEVPATGWFGRADWRLDRLKEAGPELLEYERLVLAGLFKWFDTQMVSDLKNKFYADLAKAKSALERDGVERGWFPRRPGSVRMMTRVLGLIGAAGGVFLTVAAGARWGAGLVGIPVVVGGLLLVLVSGAMSRRTASGRAILHRALGFEKYIRTAETRQLAYAERANIFAAYLPYAVAFKAVGKWAKAFRDIDMQAATSGWYYGSRPFDAGTFESSLGSFSSSVSSTLASTPGGSGGSGFSGGSSGGGGGGGGGGSW